MSDYLHPNGYTYSIEEVEMAAINAGVDYDEFVKLRGFTPTDKTRTALKLYNKNLDIDASIPTVSPEIMKLSERDAADKLRDQLKGLGYKLEQRDWNYDAQPGDADFGEAMAGFDRLVVVAPDGTEEMFEFDIDGLGALFENAKDEADRLNEFIKNTVNSTDINEEAYFHSWNYLSQRKNTAGKDLEDLSSEETQIEANEAWNELLNGNQRLPGIDRVYKEINTQLEPFVQKKILEIRKKYNLDEVADPDQYDLALEELNKVIISEHDRMLGESKEFLNIKVGIEKAIQGKYNRTIDDKLRDEAEKMHLPAWVTDNFLFGDSDFFKGVYTTSSLKLPKAWFEKNVMENGIALRKVNDEIDRINNLISDGKETLESPYLFRPDDSLTGKKGVKNPKTGEVFTNKKKLKELKEQKFELNKKLSYNVAKTQHYQNKLKDIRVPTAFGKDITDPDLTLDEWQNMMGDQMVQMVSSIGTLGYSTYAQEGGGAAIEIVEIVAAMKYHDSIPKMGAEDFFGGAETMETLELGPRQDAVNKAIDELGEDAWENMDDKEKDEYIDELMKQERIKKRAGGFSNYGNVSAEEFEEALKNFRKLPEEERRRIMLEVLDNGEVDLTQAMTVGLTNAGLDFASTVVSLIPVVGAPTGTALKASLRFAPKSLMRNIFAGNVKGTVKAASPLILAGGFEVGTEITQEGVSISGVGHSTGYYGNRKDNIKRFLEAGAQAFLTTPGVVGGSSVVKTTFKDTRAYYQAKNDPNHTRNAINNLKSGINNAWKMKDLNINERNELLDQLESEEDIINTYTEYKEMDVEQKVKVISANVNKKAIQKQIADLEAENAKLKKGMDAEILGGVNTQQIKNDLKIEDLKKKLKKNLSDIFAELKIVNDKKRSQFVNWSNRNPDFVKGAKPLDLMTTENAIKYFDKMLKKLRKRKGPFKEKYNLIKEFENGVFKLLTGQVNAFQFGKDVYSIQEIRHQLIRSDKGYGTPNAFHHDVLHVIQEGMSLEELAAMQKEIVKQLQETKDPELQKIFETAKKAFEIRYGNEEVGTKDYYLEWMANLSDAFAEYEIGNLTKDSSISLTKIANFLSNAFHVKTKVGMDWSKFGPENALEHIKEYTNFHGQRESLRIPMPTSLGKKDIDTKEIANKKLKSRYSVAELNPINDLVPKNIKTLKDYQDFLSNRKAFMPVGKALQKNGLIYNIIRKNTTPETFEKTLDEVTTRILNFNPAAKRKDGTVVGIEAFAERIFSDLGYGKMVAAKEIATKPKTTAITDDKGKAIDIEDTRKDYVEDIDYEKIESDFKRELGLTDELIEKVKIAARKTFGTKMPSLKEPRKYRKALKDAFVIELRDEVMKIFNTRKEYDKFLEKYIPLFHNQISAERWVQIERRVPKDKKIFVDSKRITSVKEVRKLQEQGLIRKDVKPASGPNLNTKLKTPSTEQIMAFFRGENMQDVLGYTVTESTLGTRKDGLADAVIEKLASRAAVSVLNNERAVAELRRDVEEISSIEQIENDIEVLADIVDEDPNVRFSNVTSIQITEQLLQLKNSIQNKGFEATFNTDGKPKIKSTNGPWLEQIYEPLYNLGKKGLFTDRQANQAVKKIFGSFKIKGENNLGDVTERIVYDLFQKVGFLVEGHQLGEKKVHIPKFYTFKGGRFQNADIMFELENGQQVALEIKFAADGTVNAGKIGVTSFNTKTGEFEYSSQDLSEDIKKITDEAVKGVVKVAKEIETLLVKKYGYPKGVSLNDVEFIHDPETLIARSPYNQKEIYRINKSSGKTEWYQNKKSETGPDLKSLKAKSNIKVKDDGTVATYHYNIKGNFYILFIGEGTGKGMYYMGVDPLETSKTLGTKRLKSNKEGFVFKARLLSRRVVKNGVKVGYKLTISGESVINTNNMAETSAFNIRSKEDVKTFQKAVNSSAQAKLKLELAPLAKATKKARSIRNSKVAKGITILDFDDTLATTKSLVKFTGPDGKTGTLNAEQYANTYEDLLDKGYVFDFSDFNKVVKGKLAPLFQKALKLQGKFGPENMFVLTARPPQAAQAIFDFLSANGLNIPIENITGLGNSTAESKALWVANKAAEGYNDFYFADDALQNVQAVKNMLNQFDVKSKIQQAKVRFSETMNDDFNKILEEVTGIEAQKRFGATKARKRGSSKGKFRLFIPPSHEDFVGLLYNFMGKGKEGNKHRDFFEKSLIKPLNRGYREIDAAKQAIANDYKSLNKQFKDVKKKFTKKTPDGNFVYEDAIRVYLWDKHGYNIPGLSKADQASLVDLVVSDPDLQAYAENLNVISKLEKYVSPQESWDGGNIRIDLIDATGRVGRAEYFTEFQENADIIFSTENLNKIEAAYGTSVRSALEDILYRIKTGVNRPKGQSGVVNKFMNYLNGSVGSVMFFNTRSSLLQQLSIVNYINFADNNIFAAAKAFANQPQYWKDFAFIFNSDMLKQRRRGIQTDINGAELAQTVAKSTNPMQSVISKLLELGFLPTQIGDNIAIATGGATFYRNRINTYLKKGLSKKEAEEKAWGDFQEITQSTQQSARPDMTSKQQASWIGGWILNFQNVTSQYNRLIKKAASDLKNRRITPGNKTQMQSDMSNISRILYYGFAQNVIFYGLQTALFAVMFGLDDEEEEKKTEQILKKKERIINGTIDSILRGSGIYGAGVSTIKNMIIKFLEQREKGYNKDESAVVMEFLNFSPVVGIKARKIVNAEKTLNYNQKVIPEMELLDIDNPIWSAVTNYIEATTNAPTNRIYNKTINLRDSQDAQWSTFNRVLMFGGYSKWNQGLGDPKIEAVKEKIKLDKEIEAYNKKKLKKQKSRYKPRTYKPRK